MTVAAAAPETNFAPRIGRSVSIDHAAKLLGVSRRTVYNRINDGRLRTVRTLGGSQRVVLESVVELRGALARSGAGRALRVRMAVRATATTMGVLALLVVGAARPAAAQAASSCDPIVKASTPAGVASRLASRSAGGMGETRRAV
jgi:excisionase family DNA binding protein